MAFKADKVAVREMELRITPSGVVTSFVVLASFMEKDLIHGEIQHQLAGKESTRLADAVKELREAVQEMVYSAHFTDDYAENTDSAASNIPLGIAETLALEEEDEEGFKPA